jgi:DNA-binding response OmpR family regulator
MNLIVDSPATPNKILLLEDNQVDLMEVCRNLESMGYVVYKFASPDKAREAFKKHFFSLVILHFGNSQMESLEICRWIRAESTVPILMLTDRNEMVDEVMVLGAGADDYISKPVDLNILASRISQQIKRSQNGPAPLLQQLTYGPLKLKLNNHAFTIDNNVVPLTNSEFKFLHLLMKHPEQVFSRAEILSALGVMRGIGTDHIVDSHASRIRSKIRQHGGPAIISVVRSVGFRLIDHPL